jgi:phosphopantothenoylcysteine synthetase/decarboxylase
VEIAPEEQGARMSLRIVVTCGPSYEPIDEVRRITNFSSGKLGAWLSEFFAAAGDRVQCLRGEMATWPAPTPPVEVIPFSTNDHLLRRLEALSEREKVDAVLHVAALADFTVKRGEGSRKLSSRAGELQLTLVPATKIIGKLRGFFPNARIVGWKYELDGTQADALAKGAAQIRENQTDVCIVNGAAYGSGFGALTPDGEHVALKGREALGKWLSAFLCKR